MRHESLQSLQESDILTVLVACTESYQLLGEFICDSTLLEQIHQKIVELTVHDVPGDRVVAIFQLLAAIHGELDDLEQVIVALLVARRLHREGAGQQDLVAAFLNGDIEVRFRHHLTKFRGILRSTLIWILSIDRVVDIELNSDGLVIELPSQGYISVFSFDVEVIDSWRNSLLPSILLCLDLIGQETTQLFVAFGFCRKESSVLLANKRPGFAHDQTPAIRRNECTVRLHGNATTQRQE